MEQARLPIHDMETQIKEAITNNQILVVAGSTGSGKTTQLPKFAADIIKGKICCTQPRRMAALAAATRVAAEMNCQVGEDVGYKIRFCDQTTSTTKIVFMTEGVLLREYTRHPDLSDYSMIIFDEAHERNVSLDILMGFLKKLLLNRPELKLIVTSATLDVLRFSKYFFDAPVLKIPGRNFTIEIIYSDCDIRYNMNECVKKVKEIHETEPPGDILVFLTGKEEIENFCLELRYSFLWRESAIDGTDTTDYYEYLLVFPMYSALSESEQAKALEPTPPGKRKVVVATNIAEVSLTIEGIVYVVDSGRAKQNNFDYEIAASKLEMVTISRAAAEQRSGRTGRTGPGKCYRMYSRETFECEMLDETEPQIKRSNICQTVLLMKFMGINDMMKFDLMDLPPQKLLNSAMTQLHEYSAIDSNGNLTDIGEKMVKFPLQPNLSKLLITSVSHHCAEELLTIVAMLNAPNFYKGIRSPNWDFYDGMGDTLSYLKIFNWGRENSFSQEWCDNNLFNRNAIAEAQNIRTQLRECMAENNMPIETVEGDKDSVIEAIYNALPQNVATCCGHNLYLFNNCIVRLHPSSVFCRNAITPPKIIFVDIFSTGNKYIRHVTQMLK